MSIFEDTDTINAILADLADREIVEPMAEPIDASDCHPLDWAEVTNLWDEIADEVYPDDFPIEAVDTNYSTWYLF